MNPSYNSDKILKKEMKSALFFGNESKEEIKGFDDIEGIERSNRVLIKKSWVSDFFKEVQKILMKKQ